MYNDGFAFWSSIRGNLKSSFKLLLDASEERISVLHLRNSEVNDRIKSKYSIKTKIIVDDSTETINIGNALNVYNSDNSVEALGAFYIGDKITDGSFRFIQNGGDLLVEKRESGVWVAKATIG